MLRSLRQIHASVYVLAFANGVVMTGFMMLVPLLPAYTRQLGFGEYEIGLLVAAFFIGRVIFQFPLGILSDRIGRRWIIWSSLGLFTAATAAYALTTVFWLMALLRLLQGVAASSLVVGSESYINDRTPANCRGLANGIASSAINVGVIAGPVLGGTLSQAFSIRAPFWAGGLLGLISFGMTLGIPDIKGFHGAAAARRQRNAPIVRSLKRALAPVWNLPAFSLSAVHFVEMMGIAILITSTPVLTAQLLSWSANEIALALALSGASAAIASPFLGWLSDAAGRVRVIAGGLLVSALEGLVIFLHPGTVLTMVALGIGGAGAPAYFNAFYSLEGDVTRPRERGALTGFVGSFGEWGSIIGSALVAPVVWRGIGVAAPMAFQAAFLAGGVVFVIAMKSALERQVSLVGRQS